MGMVSMSSTGADVHISVHGEFAKEPMDSAISLAGYSCMHRDAHRQLRIVNADNCPI